MVNYLFENLPAPAKYFFDRVPNSKIKYTYVNLYKTEPL